VRVGEPTLQAQTFAFLQELSEVVGSLPQVALVTTFPESHLEYYDHHEAPQVFARLEKIFGRVQAVRMPVQGEEIYEVLRRRLFEQIDGEGAKRVVAAYMETYEAYRNELPPEVRSGEYARKMLKAFPFHPQLVDVLYERWGTLQNFQRTRGVLRLLARVVEAEYLNPGARPLIGLGDVALANPDLRATVDSVLGEANWESVLASDIIPPDGKAYRLDREQGGEYARHRLAQSLATAIFMYSHSGGAQQGATRPQLNLALTYPEGITPLLVGDALGHLEKRLYYLYANGGWSFKAQPNLNAVLADRMAQVREEAPSLVADLVRGSLRGLSDYVRARSQQTTVTTTPSGTVIQQGQAPPLELFLGAAAAELFSVPEGTRAVVRVAEVAQGTPLTVLVLGAAGQ
jgi:hypothetical protein